MRQRASRRDGRAALAVMVLGMLLGCRAAPSKEVEVDVRNVGFDPQSGSPVVILQAREGGRVLPIWIGPAEAQAIAMELQKVTAPRPLTHDLVKRILDSTGVVLRRVRITELRQETFFASLVLDRAGREIEVDSRPSDAIALALRFACPILVSRGLLEIPLVREHGEVRQDIGAKIWGMAVQDLTPALAESLGCDGASGVVVADMEVGAVDGDLPRRGDVIVAVDGTRVGSVAALRGVADSGDGARRIEVQRDGAHLVLRVDPGGQPGATAGPSGSGAWGARE